MTWFLRFASQITRRYSDHPVSAVRLLRLLTPARAAGALLLLLGTVVTIFKACTLSGCSGLCSRGPAAGGTCQARYDTRSLLLLPWARAGGAGERTIVSVGLAFCTERSYFRIRKC